MKRLLFMAFLLTLNACNSALNTTRDHCASTHKHIMKPDMLKADRPLAVVTSTLLRRTTSAIIHIYLTRCHCSLLSKALAGISANQDRFTNQYSSTRTAFHWP